MIFIILKLQSVYKMTRLTCLLGASDCYDKKTFQFMLKIGSVNFS